MNEIIAYNACLLIYSISALFIFYDHIRSAFLFNRFALFYNPVQVNQQECVKCYRYLTEPYTSRTI